jgi:hypothetical protein
LRSAKGPSADDAALLDVLERIARAVERIADRREAS